MSASDGLLRTLIVDDEEALAKVMQRTLRSRGFQSDVALSGAAARQLIESNEYALALLDVRLPDESGYGLLEELRAKHPDTAVVMISGVDDPELGKAAVEHGAYAYFVKPVGATELYLAVVNAFRRRSMELDYRGNLRRLESLVAERTEQMAKAANVQAGLLPSSPLIGDGFEVAAHFAPAREISGDFYDWYLPEPRRLAVTLGDVMGKGLPAAILMATVRAALRSAAQVGAVEDGVQRAAGVMAAALEVNQAYATLFHGLFDVATGELHYIDAGHGHARLVRGAGAQELLAERGAPIGLLPENSFTPGTVILNPGDTLVVFSDGLLDLRPDLATKEVQLPLAARRAAHAQEMVDILAAGSRERDLPDDVTVLALRRL
ncbi:MAG: fused response regulator/phosphatase [Candidatus Dormibacteraeota bacterium]|nr:fused response regulator/phosphatase [Candidatus Dormibacteraeota bacterium]